MLKIFIIQDKILLIYFKIILLKDNSRIRSEIIYNAKQNEANKKNKGKRLKILTPKQLL